MLALSVLVSEIEEDSDEFIILATGKHFNKILQKVTTEVDTDLRFESQEDLISNNTHNFTALRNFYKKYL